MGEWDTWAEKRTPSQPRFLQGPNFSAGFLLASRLPTKSSPCCLKPGGLATRTPNVVFLDGTSSARRTSPLPGRKPEERLDFMSLEKDGGATPRLGDRKPFHTAWLNPKKGSRFWLAFQWATKTWPNSGHTSNMFRCCIIFSKTSNIKPTP